MGNISVSAFAKDNYEHFIFEYKGWGTIKTSTYIGEALLNFPFLTSERYIKNALGLARTAFENCIKEQQPISEAIKKAYFMSDKYAKENTILKYYTYFFIMQLMNGENPDTEELVKVFEAKQLAVKEDLKILLDTTEPISISKLKNDKLKFNYVDAPLIATLEMVDEQTNDFADLYKLSSIDDIIKFELLQIIKNNILYKKCKCCGEYFVPLGRTDSEYCYRIMPNEAKPCNEIGAIKTFDLLHKDDEIFRAYQQAYRRMDSRKRTKSITKDDFKSWGKKARAMRKECYDGKITFEVFQAWLDEGK